MQDVDAMFDRHLDHELREHEKRCEPVYCGSCYRCDDDLFEGDEVYEIDDCYYCEDCMDNYKITLKKK